VNYVYWIKVNVMDVTTSIATPLAAPWITAVIDGVGNSIPNNGTTQDTELTLSGEGLPGGVVTILDNGDVIGRPSVTVAGTWEISVTVALGPHSFTARAADGTVSVPWVITVISAAVKPTIDSIVDSKGVAIPQGSSTSDKNVTLIGTAEPDSTVEIKDDATSWGTELAPGGAWTKALAGLASGPHSMTAITSAGASDVWPFTILALAIDPSPVVLDATAYVLLNSNPGAIPYLPPTPAPGTYVERSAAGGTPPYSYRSSNPGIVLVDATTGLARALRNGTASVTVIDASGAEASYSVTVTDAWSFTPFALGTYSELVSKLPSGWHLPTPTDFALLLQHFGAGWPYADTWMCSSLTDGNQVAEYYMPKHLSRWRPLLSPDLYGNGLYR
jgi:hypothetical protein